MKRTLASKRQASENPARDLGASHIETAVLHATYLAALFYRIYAAFRVNEEVASARLPMPAIPYNHSSLTICPPGHFK